MSEKTKTPCDKKIRLMFNVDIPYSLMLDPDDDLSQWNGSLFQFVKEIYEDEGHFWDEELELVGAAVIDLTAIEKKDE